MLISYNWLKNYLPSLPPAETIIPKMIHAGVAVENVRPLGKDITNVVVAELLTVDKHPKADRLSLTKVTDGKQTYQVVCGAKNITPGQKIPLARVGAVLPGDFKIKEAKIRDVESFGMLCSAKELGLAEDAEGILILPPDAPVGTDFLSYMGLPDTLFELEITPNRADLLSHWGVARELGALLGQTVEYPKAASLKEGGSPVAQQIKLSIDSKDTCFLYTCRVLEGVKVCPSPLWLVQALARIGQRSINNIVDVTNYVLMETGQPLHAFDLAQLKGKQVIVRKAKKGEKIPLLDNTERELTETMMVIADAERAVALAGVMGGSNSQVTDGTTSILLESALFLPGSVRKTARALSISTDSSYRFERGVDPQGVRAALDRAADLIQQVAGGQAAPGVGVVETQVPQSPPVTYRPARSNHVLGLTLSNQAQIDILRNLGCEVQGDASSASLTVKCPSHRSDLRKEIDLIEEMARLSGYDKIPVTPPPVPSNLFPFQPMVPLEAELRSTLHRAGFWEAVNSSFLPPDYAKRLRLGPDAPAAKAHEVANPIAEDQKVLRPTLLPSLLANVRLNLSHQQETLRLYEMNKVFTPGVKLTERPQVTAVLAGLSGTVQWTSPERPSDFYDVKGLAQDLLTACGLEDVRWTYGELPAPFEPGLNFEAKDAKGQTLVRGGALHAKVLKDHDITAPCFALEIEPQALAQTSRRKTSYKALPKFPAAWRDIALVVPDGVTSEQVRDAIRKSGGPDLKTVYLFDHYRGPHVSKGFRSLAYRMQFLNEERTLTDPEIVQKVETIASHLKERYSIAIR